MSGGMNWHTVSTILRREYLERVRSKAFIAMTILIPGFMAASMLIPILIQKDGGPSTRSIGIADATGVLADSVAYELTHRHEGRARYSAAILSDEDSEDARALVRMQMYDAVLIIPEDIFTSGAAQYVAYGAPRFDEIRRMRAALNVQVTAVQLWRAGVARKDIDAIARGVSVTPEVVQQSGSQTPEAAMLGASLMAMLMYFTLILYGSWTLRGIVKDKTSRVVEILISTTSPTELMVGKIVGIGSVGLTQVGIWTAALAAAAIAMPDSTVGMYASALPGMILPAFIAYYIAGFLLFASLYAGVGAISTNEEDAQQLQWPVMLLLIVPLFLLSVVVGTPDRPFIVVLSYVPFFSPVLMLCRILLGSAGWISFAVTIGLMLLTGLLVAWVAGKLFRVGILMTGKRPSLRDIVRFLREG